MKRLRPLLLNALTLLSLPLFATTIALWVRSYGGCDYIQRLTPAT